MSKGKKIALLVLVAVVVVFAGIKVAQVVDANLEAREQTRLARTAAEALVLPIAETYGLTDLTFDHVEDRKLAADTYFASAQFSSLSDEEKLGFIVAVSSASRLQHIFPEESDLSNRYFDLVILCGEDEYTDFTDRGKSRLLKNGDTVLEMRTEYAASVTESLNQALAEWKGQQGSQGGAQGSNACSRCNGTGSVKYYYGDSALEAALDGHEDSWYGQCGSCGGTGIAK